MTLVKKLPRQPYGTVSNDADRVTIYVPKGLKKRLLTVLDKQYNGHPPYGAMTAIIRVLIQQYVESAEHEVGIRPSRK